jgi:hypothetical protein
LPLASPSWLFPNNQFPICVHWSFHHLPFILNSLLNNEVAPVNMKLRARHIQPSLLPLLDISRKYHHSIVIMPLWLLLRNSLCPVLPQVSLSLCFQAWLQLHLLTEGSPHTTSQIILSQLLPWAHFVFSSWCGDGCLTYGSVVTLPWSTSQALSTFVEMLMN